MPRSQQNLLACCVGFARLGSSARFDYIIIRFTKIWDDRKSAAFGYFETLCCSQGLYNLYTHSSSPYSASELLALYRFCFLQRHLCPSSRLLMATVHGPLTASHPSPFRSTHNASHPRAYQPPVSTFTRLFWRIFLKLPLRHPPPNHLRHSPLRVGRIHFTVTSRRQNYAPASSLICLPAPSTPRPHRIPQSNYPTS